MFALGGKADIDGAGAAVGGRQKLHQQTDIKVPRISRVFRTHFSVKFMTRYAAAFHIRGQVKHRGKVRGHPVLTAAVMGAAVVTDAAGGMKVDKGKSEGSAVCRVDPAVAAIMAAGAKRPPAREFMMTFI